MNDTNSTNSCDEVEVAEAATLLQRTAPEVLVSAKGFLNDSDLLNQLGEDIESIGVAGERALATMVYIVGTSRLLPKPLALLVQGQSSSGKSYVIDRVAELFPPEAVIRATHITPQALYHMRDCSLKHRFVVAGERPRYENDEQANGTKALREMISSGRLSKLIAGKSEKNKVETEHAEQEGPIAYVESTTLSRIFNEDANRMVFYPTDDSPEQTGRVLQAEAVRRSQGAPVVSRSIIERHHTIQRKLTVGTRTIAIPYAEALAGTFPSNQVEARRVFGQVLSVIEAVALLHMLQRETDDDSRIVATRQDYEATRILMESPLARVIGGTLTPGAKRLYEKLRERFADGTEFTIPSIVREFGWSNEAVRQWLQELQAVDLITQTDRAHGRYAARYIVTEHEPTAAGPLVLPPWEELVDD